MKIKFSAILLFVLHLTGCAISNEGKVDFRRTNNQQEAKDCTELKPLKIKNNSLGKNSVFNKGDTLSLHLRSAFIRDFSENIITPFVENAFTKQWPKTIGEIVIVANAFEERNGKELNFENTTEGRVVFYSNNVHKGQLLNFDNMPIYGPMQYDGAPFAFRISIFELDVTSERTKAMLSTLANAGSRAYPPASPVLNLLNEIGNSLFNGDQNDTEFRYSMVLDPKGGIKEISHLALEAGNYVLARVEDREKEIPWNNLVLNENEGRLYLKKENIPYTDNTYIIIEINKNVSNVKIELAENNFSSLLNTLQEQDKQKAASIENTRAALMDIAIQRSQIINFSRAKEILYTINTQEDKFENRVLAKELMAMIANSVDDEGKILSFDSTDSTIDKRSILSDQQIKYVLKNIRNIGNVSRNINSNNFNLLETNSIRKGFKPNGNINTQKNILNLISPI